MEYCEQLGDVIRIIKAFIQLIQFVIPIGLVIFGVIDLGKAVISSKEDEMKLAQKLLIKRVIYAIAVFLVVTLVSLVMTIVSNNVKGAGAKESWITCWNNTKVK